MIIFQATKYKFLEYFIDTLFTKIHLNFARFSSKVILPSALTEGMKIKEIICYSPLMVGMIYRDCIITSILIDTKSRYEINFEFDNFINDNFINGMFPMDDNRYDTIYVQGNDQTGFLFVGY